MTTDDDNAMMRDLRNRTRDFGAVESGTGIIRCDACPVLCRIKPGRSGACDRYANEDTRLVRVDPLTLMQRTLAGNGATVPFALGRLPLPQTTREEAEAEIRLDGQPAGQSHGSAGLTDETAPGPVTTPDRQEPVSAAAATPANTFVTGIGAGTTYPDYKPAPFIVSALHEGVDTVTIVTEGIFSYCGVKVKIDTDRHLGAECAAVRSQGEQIGHVTTAEYGSQMLSLGGVRHLTGGTRREGRITCESLLALCNREPITLDIDDGSQVVVQAGKAPIVNGVEEQRMRVGCGSATIGIFAKQWAGQVDEVIVVDDHITGVLTEHQAGRCLDLRPAGIRVDGHKSTPGRYFRVANPGTGWGGTDITDPLTILRSIDPAVAWPGLRLLITSTTGEDVLYVELDDELQPRIRPVPAGLAATVERIGENCEPSLCTVLFMAGAGGSLRAGVTENPIQLTRSVALGLTRVTLGGAPAYVYPGGGITIMVDVQNLPDAAFGHVPTPALVAPIEFTMAQTLYLQAGGHTADVVDITQVIEQLADESRIEPWQPSLRWPLDI